MVLQRCPVETANNHPHCTLGGMTSFDLERLHSVRVTSVCSVVSAGNRSARCMSAASVFSVRVRRFSGRPENSGGLHDRYRSPRLRLPCAC